MSIDFGAELKRLRAAPAVDFEEELARLRATRGQPSRPSIPQAVLSPAERVAGAITGAVEKVERAPERAIAGLGGARDYPELYRKAGIPEALAGEWSPLTVATRLATSPIAWATGGIGAALRAARPAATGTQAVIRKGVAGPAVELAPRPAVQAAAEVAPKVPYAGNFKLPPPAERLATLERTGVDPIRERFLFHVVEGQKYRAGGISPDPRGVVYLSADGPVIRGQGTVFAVDRTMLDPSKLKATGGPSAFYTYEGVIPESAILNLGERSLARFPTYSKIGQALSREAAAVEIAPAAQTAGRAVQPRAKEYVPSAQTIEEAKRAFGEAYNKAIQSGIVENQARMVGVRAAGQVHWEARTLAALERAGVSPIEQKVILALKKAAPVREQTEALYSAERSRRLGEAMAAGERVPGEAGFRQQLGALKGELPKAQFEPIRGPIGQADIDSLFGQVRASPLLSGFDKITAQTGLGKLFGTYGGTVPTAGELKLLGRVFSPEFVKAALAKRGLLTNILETGAEIIVGVPRAIMASTDLSAPFRQGVVALPSFPKQFGQSFVQMFRYFGNEKAFQGLKENIVSRPTFDLMERHGLALTGLDKGILVGREEQFISTLAERIPGFGRIVHASNRAYTGFLTKLRADAFDEMLRRAEAAGVEQAPAMIDSVARFINSATGRGAFAEGGALNQTMGTLSTILFSPRLLASRLNILNPLWYTSLDPFARKQALKGSLSLVALGTTVLGLAKAGGAQVGVDPRSADFGKIKVGNTRWDIWGGLQQYPRLVAQLLTGKLISSTTGKEYTLGEGYRPITRKDIALRFFESKANPTMGFAIDLLQGKDFAGQPLHIPARVRDLFVPMVLQDVADIYREDPSLLPWAAPAFFGVGMQTYGPKKRKR